ncbi:endocuticle structural glycoprotein ABD-4 [Contarinia nasturtii]|uniref:endocuticle structural glycoprotein ABD-4 n=1 Tax=Contarinia nasturtii TaxID=265458 RepID=UPI0012D4BDDA|nr:endocuticle structural glycoprotein ABD-4 [Contarinia nasturtii]
MKVLILATVCLAACAVAQHHQHQQQSEQLRFDTSSTTTWIPILAYNKEQGQDGSYKASYKTGNNIDAQETGFLKDINEQHPNGILVQHGEYQYEAPNGEVVKVQYTADEHGFRAIGDHIPTAPPIPLEIQKGLEQIFDGIKKNAELNAQRAKSDPEFAKKQEARAQADYYGHYVPSK